MVNMTPPKNRKQVSLFICLVNYYRYMWSRKSNLSQPLTTFTSEKVEFKRKDVEQKAFNEIKHAVTRDNFLA